MIQKTRYFIQHYPGVCIVLIFLLAELIINPVGNFPLNDDWWYAEAYKKLFETPGTNKIPWGATSLVGQLVLTKPFATIFGCSYTALRCFTLILSVSTLIFIFKTLINHLKADNIPAFLLCLVFLFSPLFLALSNSYMSDVPFLFFLSGGFYFYFDHKKKEDLTSVFLCAIFFVFAILTRQLTIAFLIGISVSEIVVHRKISLFTLIVLFVPSAVLFCFELWIQTRISNPIYTYVFFRNLPILNKIGGLDIFINLCKRWIHFINYSGFVLFPILIPYLFHYLKTVSYRVIKKEFIVTFVLYVPIAISMNKFPLGNYLFNFGIGPDTLYDFFTPEYGKTLQAPILFMVMKTIAYVSSFSLLLALVDHIFSHFPNLKRETLSSHHHSVLLVSCLAFYYGAMCCTCAIFDRYIVPFTFLILLLIHKQVVPALGKKPVFISSFFSLLLFSTFGTRDCLNSNRARWEVIAILKEEYNAGNGHINGGYEHLGSSFPDNEDWYPKWTNAKPNLYMVSRQNIPNYRKLGAYSYQRFMPLRKDTIFYLKLDTSTAK